MAEKTIILITGANTGIGFQTVKALAGSSGRSYTILLGGRSLEKVHAAIESLLESYPQTKSTFFPLQIDVTDDSSIEKAFKEVESSQTRIDVLINNAGAAFDHLIEPSSPSTIREAWNKAYDVNVSGTQVTTCMFMPLLLKSSDPRLLFVTSGLSSLETASQGRISASQNRPYPPRGWPKPAAPSVVAYRSSKTALNMMMIDWCRILKEDGVKIWAISPGFLATNLTGTPEYMKKIGASDPALGGNFIKDVVEGKRDADVGRVIHRDGVAPW